MKGPTPPKEELSPTPSTEAGTESQEEEEKKEEYGDHDELLLAIQKKDSDASLIIAQNEIDILSAELDCALRALAGSKGTIDDLTSALKSKESSLAKLQLHYDLLTAEIEAQQYAFIEDKEVIQSSTGKSSSDEHTQSDEDTHCSAHPSCATSTVSSKDTLSVSFNDTSSLEVDVKFADFKTIPDLAIAATESTSMSSQSYSRSSTEGSLRDQGRIGDSYYPRNIETEDEDDDESISKALLGGKNLFSSSSSHPLKSLAKPKAVHHPAAWHFPFIKVDRMTNQAGRISPLSDCSGGVRDRLGDIMIGYIEADCTFNSDMAEI